MPEERRSKLEIFFDILYAINSEYTNGIIKPTKLQTHVKMSYDKLMKYLKELEEKEFVKIEPISMTQKGERFLRDYSNVVETISVMKNKYLDIDFELDESSNEHTILVVDDNEDLLNMLTAMITHFGYSVRQAKDGKQAIIEYEKHKPDLVLMDINMPIKDGYESFFEITKKFPTARVIFMTGFKDFSKWQKAKKRGAIYLVQKPFPPIFLKELISRHISEVGI